MRTSIKIGRDKSNDIIINEPRVSRTHAIITDIGGGNYEIKDLGSTNGTFVNGQMVKKVTIKQGDKVEVGSSLVNWWEAITQPLPDNKNASIHEKPFAGIRKTISVGSGIDNDLVINDPYVSSGHAKLSLLTNGNYYIQDLNSSNGSFVNGSKVVSKNFSKTDNIKLASNDLPEEWFNHKNLQTSFYQDHKSALLVLCSMLILVIGGFLFYYKSCSWFNCNCILSSQQLYSTNKNSIVYITHSYFYTIELQGRKYYVGKNMELGNTDANTDKARLLPYTSVTGSGCFIKDDGTIITSSTITNPWLNEPERNKMLSEFKALRVIDNINLLRNARICGESHELKFISNGLINNPGNYSLATSNVECVVTDSASVLIQSIKKEVPKADALAGHYFNKANEMHQTSLYYYTVFKSLNENSAIRDTFYSAPDSFNINKLSFAKLNDSLPPLSEGSAVFNERGELIGLIDKQKLIFLHSIINQIKK